MKIILVRHGESEFNALTKANSLEKKYCGQYDTPLSILGRSDALKLKNNIHIKGLDIIYSSDLSRATETAYLATGTTDIIATPLLRERSLGDFEGLIESEVPLLYKDFFRDDNKDFRNSFINHAPNGENYIDVCGRCLKFLDNLDLTKNITVGIFAHNCTIRCMIHVLTSCTEQETLNRDIKNTTPIILTGSSIGEFNIV